MDGLFIDYAGMNAAEISIWLLIATGVGLLARMIVRGRRLLGLWGDAAIGLIGVFAIGTVMRAFSFDLAAWIATNIQALSDVALWVDVAVSGFVGALVIRIVLRPFTGRG